MIELGVILVSISWFVTGILWQMNREADQTIEESHD